MKTKLRLLGALLLALLLTICNPLPAQEVKWGPIRKGGPKITLREIVSHHADRTVVVGSKGRGLLNWNSDRIFERLDAGFASTLIMKVKPELAKTELEVSFCFESNGQIYLFASSTDRKIGKRELYYQAVDAQKLTLSGTATKVAELTFERRWNQGNFRYAFSRDSSHIVIYANTELRKNEPDKYALYVFDQDLEPLWQKEVTLPYAESRFGVQEFAIDNDGNVFVLGVKYQEKGETKRRGKPNYEYRILGYREDGTEVDEYEIKLGDMFLSDMKIDVSPKKDIVVAGFYSEVGTFSIKGTYYARIGRKSKEVEKKSSKEFDLDFITLNFTERQENKTKRRAAKGKNVELYEYDLRDIIPRADGGAVLMAEQYYITVVCHTNPKTGATTCNTYYHYNDVIIVSIDRNGDIEWASKLPKRQTSVNDGGYYSSYVSMVTNENLYLIYNDNKKNLDPTLKQGMYYNFTVRDKYGIVVLATVDHEGKVSRSALFPNTEIEAITVPMLCKQVNRRELLLYAKRRNQSQFGIVTF